MVTGLTEAEKAALAGKLAEIAARPGVDCETANRATWLLWHLMGFQPYASYRQVWDRESA